MSLITGSGGLAKGPRSVQLEIESQFNRNKRVLGAFYQVDEKIKFGPKGKNVSLERPVGDVVFKKGKLHIIRPVQEGRITNYKVLALPIRHQKGKLNLNLEGSKAKMLDLYERPIRTALTKKFGEKIA